jgi:hypothetical protein
MANPTPCGICQQVPEADFLVTDRTPDFLVLGAPTMGVCVHCMVDLGRRLGKALALAEAPDSAPVPVGAGVLERIEDDEGAAPIPPSSSSPKRPKRQASSENGAPVSEEAEAAHDHG